VTVFGLRWEALRLDERRRNQAAYKTQRLLSAAAIAVCVATFASLAHSADPDLDRGAELFMSDCARCHEVGADAKHKVGPHLDLIFERIAGTAVGFRYSKALIDAGDNGLHWTEDTLSAYIEKPRTYIKGNRMSYRGMADASDRANLIAWLKRATNALPSQTLSQEASLSDTAAPGFTAEILSIDGDPDYGEYLAGDCVTCHQPSGAAEGIPSIVGVPKDYFIRALVEYKTNVRTNEVMKIRVQNLGNEEIAHLAAYFASLEPQ